MVSWLDIENEMCISLVSRRPIVCHAAPACASSRVSSRNIYIRRTSPFGRVAPCTHRPSRNAIYLARTTSEVDTSTSHVVAGSQS